VDSDEQSVANTGGSVWTVMSSLLRIQEVLYGQEHIAIALLYSDNGNGDQNVGLFRAIFISEW
jgi:hypothetical protein